MTRFGPCGMVTSGERRYSGSAAAGTRPAATARPATIATIGARDRARVAALGAELGQARIELLARDERGLGRPHRKPVVVDPVVHRERELAAARIGHDRESGRLGVGQGSREEDLERDCVVAHDGNDRDAAAQRERARGGDADPQPGERPWSHAGGDMCERLAGSGDRRGQRLLQQCADRFGVTERVLARPFGQHDAVVFDHRDGGADRGVDGEDHASRVVGAPMEKPFRPRRRIAIVNPLPHPLPLRTDGAALGLRRLVVPTSVGEVVVHAGRESGGPATILLHGAAGSWTTWTPLISASDLSSARLTDVIALDLPGWGESGGFDRVRTVEDVSDAVAEVARAFGYSSWRLVGHSLGGFVALDVAARYPDATLGVTLVSATGTGVLGAVRRPLRGGLALPWFAGMLLTMRALAVLGVVGSALVRLVGRLGWLRALSSPLFAGPVHPSVIAAFADELRPAAFSRAARLAADYEERTWTGVSCPVRSVRGAPRRLRRRERMPPPSPR